MVAGGADSYGYVSQAGYWQRGSVVVQEDVIRPSPWPGAPLTWSPLGYRPSPNRPDAIVPLYAPGLPLLMALFQLVAGFCGAFLVVPLCGALTIWLTYLLGRRVFDAPGIALWGASLVATSPVFLYQLMNAMSDVPVTAAWTLALRADDRAAAAAAGLAMSAAIAIRPNLAPLAARAVPVDGVSEARESGRAARHRVAALAAGVAVSVVGIALFNARVYESALTSGYGTTSDLYALGFFSTNVRQFAVWIAGVETPLVALAGLFFVAPALLPPARIRIRACCSADRWPSCALSYLFYQPFDAWWYLAISAADVAGDDAADGGGARSDGAALAASGLPDSRWPRRWRFSPGTASGSPRDRERVRSRPRRAPVHRRRAIRRRRTPIRTR